MSEPRLPYATIEVFTAIATHGSLRAAADALGLQPSTVSHHLKTLEHELGTTLIVRTTRRLELTDAGRALRDGAGPALAQIADAVERARTTGEDPGGTLKLALPEYTVHLGLQDALHAFSRAHPKLHLELCFSDGLHDIVESGLHAGFRAGNRVAPDMVAVPLTGPLDVVVAASPRHLAQHGVPRAPQDLVHHTCVHYRFTSAGRHAPWTFASDNVRYDVDVPGRLTVNTLPALRDAARADLGLIRIFRASIAGDLAAGDLVSVLDSHVPPEPGLCLYYPRAYRSIVPLRLLIAHLKTTALT